MATSEEYLDSLLRAVLEGPPKPANVPEETTPADVIVSENQAMPEENTASNIPEENTLPDSKPEEDALPDSEPEEDALPDSEPEEDALVENTPDESALGENTEATPEGLASDFALSEEPVSEKLDNSPAEYALDEEKLTENSLTENSIDESITGEYDLNENVLGEYSLEESTPLEENLEEIPYAQSGTDENNLSVNNADAHDYEELNLGKDAVTGNAAAEFTMPEDKPVAMEAEPPKTEQRNSSSRKVITPEELADMVDRLDDSEGSDLPEDYSIPEEYATAETPATSEEYNFSEEYNSPEETDLLNESDWPETAGELEDIALPEAFTDTDTTGEKKLSPDDLEDIFAEMNAHLGTGEDVDAAVEDSLNESTVDTESPDDNDISAADILTPDALAPDTPEWDALEMDIPDSDASVMETQEPDDNDLPVDSQSLDDLLATDDFTEGDDFDALLNIPEIKAADMDDKTLLPEADGTNPEDMDIGDLLADMGDDEDLSEIRGLLDKDDNNELVEDEDMLALLDGMSEYGGKNGEEDKDDILNLLNSDEPEGGSDKDKKRKKKEAAGKKKGAGNKEDQEIDLSELDGIMRNGGKKKGFFSRLFSALTDADEEPEAGTELQSITDENQAILNELAVEDKKGAKGKKAKGKKKKGKGSEAADGEDNPENGGRGRRDADEEEAPEGKKKKPKKEKPKKEKKKPETIEPIKREKKVSPKKIILVVVFCASLTAAIFTVCSFLPDYEERAEARKAYLNEDYKTVYRIFYGKSLSKGDMLLFNQSSVILQMNRKLESYQNYQEMGMPAEALHALLQGVTRYETLIAEDLYEVQDKVSAVYQMILDVLASDFGVSEADAQEIVALDEAAYGERIASIVFGTDYSSPVAEPEAAGDNTPVTDANEPVDPSAADVNEPVALTEENAPPTDGLAEEGEIIP